jgi:hypothetical protein
MALETGAVKQVTTPHRKASKEEHQGEALHALSTFQLPGGHPYNSSSTFRIIPEKTSRPPGWVSRESLVGPWAAPSAGAPPGAEDEASCAGCTATSCWGVLLRASRPLASHRLCSASCCSSRFCWAISALCCCDQEASKAPCRPCESSRRCSNADTSGAATGVLPEGGGTTDAGPEDPQVPMNAAAEGAKAGEAPRKSRGSGSGGLGPSRVLGGSHWQLEASSSSSAKRRAQGISDWTGHDQAIQVGTGMGGNSCLPA